MAYEQLKLENQLCFPVYAASRLITRQYQPFLDELGITYPQYLVFLVLWEQDSLTVNEIAQKLILNTNTITPLLKRMEKMEFIDRKRSEKDERKVVIELSKKGKQLEEKAAKIPTDLLQCVSAGDELDLEELKQLKNSLNMLIDKLSEK